MKPQQMHILLTGASGGIGQATALRLATAGARIIAVGRTPAPLEALANRLPPVDSGPHLAIAADLTQSAARKRMTEQLMTLEQPPNVLINMAGTNQLCLFEQQDEATIEQLIHLNFTSSVLLTHALIPLLRSRPEARIINVGSTLGSIGYPGYVSYCSTKFALRGFSEALGRELADSPIKVQYFAPRATRTSLNAGAADALNEELRTPVDSPEAVADALLAFISGSASHRYLGWPEKLFVRLNGLFPSLVSGSISKQLDTIKNHATKRPEKLS
ncbi:SDR family oxidoreductase [Motiliproteus sediminis]|uniref:SDR family oxidoreductase n=1 Tax=Motiliproteus sediminis TaxID=1468178 RepID=UPI001AF02391|nr:SDR family oxidoreductase [Motiliproteus sediminis]